MHLRANKVDFAWYVPFKSHVVLHFTSFCWFYKRYLYDQLWLGSESVSMFYLRSSLSQQQLFYQPVCLSTYFIYKKQAKPFQCPHFPQLPVGLLPVKSRRGRLIYLCKIKQWTSSLIGQGGKDPPTVLVVIQHLPDFASAWISLVHTVSESVRLSPETLMLRAHRE